MPLLCTMPLVSVVVIVAFIYVGISGQLTYLTEILIAVSVVLMLFVTITQQELFITLYVFPLTVVSSI